jgi:hypothetical protein
VQFDRRGAPLDPHCDLLARKAVGHAYEDGAFHRREVGAARIRIRRSHEGASFGGPQRVPTKQLAKTD